MGKFFKGCLIAAVILVVSGILLIVVTGIWGGASIWRTGWDEIRTKYDSFFGAEDSAGNARAALEEGQSVASSIGSALADQMELPASLTAGDLEIFDKDHDILSGDLGKQVISTGEIKNLQLQMGNCELTISESDDDSCYLKIKEGDQFQFYQEEETLYIKALDTRGSLERWWGGQSWNCEVDLWLPEGVTYEELYLELGAGKAQLNELTAQDCKLKVGAGTVRAKSLEAESLEAELGAGVISIDQMDVVTLNAQVDAGKFQSDGRIGQNAAIECNIGSVNLELGGDVEDYNYDISCAVGTVRIGDKKYSGMNHNTDTIDNNSHKSMKINCSLGEVSIKF
jgi:hypothetical protein